MHTDNSVTRLQALANPCCKCYLQRTAQSRVHRHGRRHLPRGQLLGVVLVQGAQHLPQRDALLLGVGVGVRRACTHTCAPGCGGTCGWHGGARLWRRRGARRGEGDGVVAQQAVLVLG